MNDTHSEDPITIRIEQLESEVSTQGKSNRRLSVALVVSLIVGASHFEWVKNAWAVAYYVTLHTVMGEAADSGYATLTYGGNSSATIKGSNYGSSGIGVQG